MHIGYSVTGSRTCTLDAFSEASTVNIPPSCPFPCLIWFFTYARENIRPYPLLQQCQHLTKEPLNKLANLWTGTSEHAWLLCTLDCFHLASSYANGSETSLLNLDFFFYIHGGWFGGLAPYSNFHINIWIQWSSCPLRGQKYWYNSWTLRGCFIGVNSIDVVVAESQIWKLQLRLRP